MANLPEQEKWEDVYQWETSDRALGGPGGVMNKPIRNLTNRTAFLKKQLEDNTGQATEAKAGIVKLNNATNSNSNTEAATPASVKKAYDLASGKLSKESNLSDLTDITAALQNLGLGEAALRAIGDRDNQIPDMSFFSSGTNWLKLPSGHIVQFGQCVSNGGSRDTWPINKYPIPFPNAVICSPIAMHSGSSAAATSLNFIVDSMGSLTSFRVGNNAGTLQYGAYIVIGY